jgi:Skp family chaperone for outer membrane proteins
MKKMLSLLFFAALSTAHAGDILINDTRDAITRVNAMKLQFAKVDQQIKAIRNDYEKAEAPLRSQLESLRDSAAATADSRKQKAALLIAISNLQSKASAQQQAAGVANEKAMAVIEMSIQKAEAQIKAERGAQAVLRAQEVLYFSPTCPCNITEEVYKRVNAGAH